MSGNSFPKAKSVDFLNSVDTRIDKETLFKIGEQIFKLPENPQLSEENK